jgi:hypothetical protein
MVMLPAGVIEGGGYIDIQFIDAPVGATTDGVGSTEGIVSQVISITLYNTAGQQVSHLNSKALLCFAVTADQSLGVSFHCWLYFNVKTTNLVFQFNNKKIRFLFWPGWMSLCRLLLGSLRILHLFS